MDRGTGLSFKRVGSSLLVEFGGAVFEKVINLSWGFSIAPSRFFDFDYRTTSSGEYSGVYLMICFLYFSVDLSIGDSRTWNLEKGRWNDDDKDGIYRECEEVCLFKNEEEQWQKRES